MTDTADALRSFTKSVLHGDEKYREWLMNECERYIKDEVLDNSVSKAWQEFRDAGLLWWLNRQLHLFGYTITYTYDDDKTLMDVRPTRTDCRGFLPTSEINGFIALHKYMNDNSENLLLATVGD